MRHGIIREGLYRFPLRNGFSLSVATHKDAYRSAGTAEVAAFGPDGEFDNLALQELVVDQRCDRDDVIGGVPLEDVLFILAKHAQCDEVYLLYALGKIVTASDEEPEGELLGQTITAIHRHGGQVDSIQLDNGATLRPSFNL